MRLIYFWRPRGPIGKLARTLIADTSVAQPTVASAELRRRAREGKSSYLLQTSFARRRKEDKQWNWYTHAVLDWMFTRRV
jgi:hypothetical protein